MNYEKIITTLVRLLSVGEAMWNIFKDGVQPVQDGLAVWAQVPDISLIVKDGPEAWAEMRALPPDAYDTVLSEIARRVDLVNDEAEYRIRAVAQLSARTAAEIEGDVAVVQAWVAFFEAQKEAA